MSDEPKQAPERAYVAWMTEDERSRVIDRQSALEELARYMMHEFEVSGGDAPEGYFLLSVESLIAITSRLERLRSLEGK